MLFRPFSITCENPNLPRGDLYLPHHNALTCPYPRFNPLPPRRDLYLPHHYALSPLPSLYPLPPRGDFYRPHHYALFYPYPCFNLFPPRGDLYLPITMLSLNPTITLTPSPLGVICISPITVLSLPLPLLQPLPPSG